MSVQNASFEEIVSCLKGARTIALSGHINPDGDSLGSVLALTTALRTYGCDATPLLAQDKPAPELYAFMEGYEAFIPACAYDEDPDVFVSLDAPTLVRIGDSAEVLQRAKKSIALDHHPDMEPFADICYGNPSAAACAVIVWNIIEMLIDDPGATIATQCYVALLTDTGRFQFQNTNTEALHLASRLVEAGASPSKIASDVFQNRTYASIQLEARLIDRVKFSCNGKVAFSWVVDADFEELGASRDDSEGLPDVLRSLKGVEIALLLRGEEGGVRANLRAKSAFDVGAIARALGGGGHAAAAGFTLNGSFDDALASVLPVLEAVEESATGGAPS